MSDTEDGRELEEILDQRITIETNILDFFLISRWKGDWVRYSPVFIKGNINTQKKIVKFVQERWNTLPRNVKGLETRFYNYCYFTVTSRWGYEVRTLGDLKKLIENPDLKFRNLGHKSIAHYNERLKMYGVEPFNVGARRTSAEYLKRCG